MNRLRGMVDDRRGVSAIEFALVAPVLILAYFGLAELCGAMLAERKTSHVASAIGDLVAQASVLHDSDMSNIFASGAIIMTPNPTTGLQMRITSVQEDSNGVTTVGWSDGSGLAANTPGAAISIPPNLIGPGESIIKAEAAYTYNVPVAAYLLPSAFSYTDTFYLRPRIVDPIARTSP